MAKIWVSASKNIVCMMAWDELCAQIGPACYPDSIDTLISLIPLNLAELLSCAYNIYKGIFSINPEVLQHNFNKNHLEFHCS